jgi:hypothetical protein
MTPRDQEALAIYQETRNEPRAVAESMLDQFFNFPSQDEYERDIEILRQLFARKS